MLVRSLLIFAILTMACCGCCRRCCDDGPCGPRPGRVARIRETPRDAQYRSYYRTPQQHQSCPCGD